MIRPVIVFDFDGVVCDSTDECLVTSWNAWERWNGRSGYRARLEEFTRAERDAFRPLRPYVAGAGAYYVLRRCLEENLPIHAQADFDRYCQDWQANLEAFKRLFYQERERLRAANLSAWLDLHPVWPEVVEAISRFGREGRAYIATLKDGESVRLILQAHGATLAAERILDQSRIASKLEALEMIRTAEGCPAGDVVFLDDNATHLLGPARAGFVCYLAGWGNTLAEHVEMARQGGIPVIGLEQVLTMASGEDAAAAAPR